MVPVGRQLGLQVEKPSDLALHPLGSSTASDVAGNEKSSHETVGMEKAVDQ